MARPTNPTILPDSSCLHLVRLEADEQSILAVVATTSSEALCPLCQCRSESVHSRYVRCVADLPWAGWAVRLELHVRRFFCQNKECVRQIFTERLPSVVAPYARCTLRLCDLFTLIGFALGGEAGKRLVDGMGLETSPDRLLRLIREHQESQVPTPRVLGVDDFSFCRRRSYSHRSRTAGSHRLASRPRSRDVQKVVARPPWRGDHQSRSRWFVCRRGKAGSPSSEANC
jgi:transposase